MILITGGAGYIGSHTNKYLHSMGFETIVFDNLVYGHKEFVKWGKFIEGDLGEIESIRKVFANNKIEAVIHFAAYAYVGESVIKPNKYYQNNLRNTINLLQVMTEFDCKNIIFSSTCATYGEPEYIPIDESHNQNPINPYGKSKYFVEQIIKDYHSANLLNYCIFRYFNAAGADVECEIGEWHEPETHLIPLVLDAVIGKRENISVFGTDYATPDGTCVRDYIHVTDLAQAHYLGFKHLLDGNSSDVFNLGNGIGFSVNEIIETAKKITQRDINVVYSERRPGDPSSLIGSSEKARKILNWTPEYFEIKKIISSAWSWHQKLYNMLNN